MGKTCVEEMIKMTLPKWAQWVLVGVFLVGCVGVSAIFVHKDVQQSDVVSPVANKTADVLSPTQSPIPGQAPSIVKGVRMDDFSADLFPLDQEKALKEMNFFIGMKTVLNGQINRENAENEVDQAIRGYVPDARQKVRFVRGADVLVAVYNGPQGLTVQKNVKAIPLDEKEYTTYLVEMKDPMDKQGLAKIFVTKTYREGKLVMLTQLDSEEAVELPVLSSSSDGGGGPGGNGGSGGSTAGGGGSGGGPSDTSIH